MNKLRKVERNVIFTVLIAVIFIIVIRYNQDYFYNIYSIQNHISLHNLFELIVVIISLLIAFQGWSISPYKMSLSQLYISGLFMAVGFFSLLHIQGIPFVNAASRGVWFLILARLTEAIGILLILILKEKKLEKNRRNGFFLASLVYVILMVTVVMRFDHLLPKLYLIGEGPSIFKIYIEYVISTIHFATIAVVIYKYKQDKRSINLYLVSSLTFLFISDLILADYSQLLDFDSIIAHSYKVIGYIYLLNIVFIHNVKDSFLEKESIQKDNFAYQQKLTWMIEQLPGAIQAFDTDLKLTLINKSAKKALGYKEDDNSMIGENLEKILLRIGVQEGNTLCRRALETDNVFVKERVKIRDRIFHADVTPIKNPDTNELLGGIAYFFDITEEEIESIKQQKILENYLNHTQNLERLIESIPIAFLAVDHTGKIILSNDRALNFLKLDADVGLMGKDLHFMSDIIKLPLEKLFIYRALQGEEIYNEHNQILDYEMLINAYPIKSHIDGSLIGAIALYQDITELEILRNEISNMERLNLVGQMAASITHEIRNPMATVRGFVQLLSERANDEFKNYYHIIMDELDRANSIISDFLSLSQNRIIEMNVSSLNEIIRELLPILMADSNIKGQFIELHLDDSIPPFHMNRKEMKQLLLNLTRNGTEAMAKGGTLKIQTLTKDNVVELKVSDTGKGIPKNMVNKLFEPFFTTKDRGTGLGLAVSRSIVEKHKGSIRVESEENVGTTFIVSFKQKL